MAATRRRKLVPRHEMIPSLPRNDSVIAASRLALATSGHAFHVLNIARFGAMGIGGATKDYWMIVSTAYRRPAGFAAAALCSLALIALATPAAARPHHGAHRHHHSHVHHAHHARHYARMRHAYRVRHYARRGYGAASFAAAGFQPQSFGGGFGGSGLVAEARRYIGGNPTGRSRLWCARFMNMVLTRSGHRGTGSDMARSFASYGQRISGAAGRRYRGDVARPPRRACRHRQRHRSERQPDRDLRQSRPPRRRGGLSAVARLRLRHANELMPHGLRRLSPPETFILG